MSGPLSHLRVVDVTASLAGAYAARLLGELGADVDRVRRMRNLYVRLKGREMPEWDPLLHRSLNANKAHRSDTDAETVTPESLLAVLDGQDILIEDIGMFDGDTPFVDWDAVHSRYPPPERRFPYALRQRRPVGRSAAKRSSNMGSLRHGVDNPRPA